MYENVLDDLTIEQVFDIIRSELTLYYEREDFQQNLGDIPYVCLYRCYEEELADFTDEELGQLIRRLMHYLNTGEVTPAEGVWTKFWNRYRIQHDRDAEHYNEVCDKRKSSIQKRWKGNAKTDPADSDTFVFECKEKEKDKEKDKEKEKEKVCVLGERTPVEGPSLEDIILFCEQEGLTAVDHSRFWNYYNSIGWMMGGKPMRDWRSAVRMWNQEDAKKQVSEKSSEVNYGETF